MKKIIKLIGLTSLILFSFFYTDKVTQVIRENDTLMTEIKRVKDNYNSKSVNGIINGKTIIPGITGRKINIDKSYKKMREKGLFDEDLIVYDKILPKNNLNNNIDKFIISGNKRKNMISIIFLLNNYKYLERINNTIYNKNITINYFVDYKFLINNSPLIKELNNCEVYNYGNNGEYTPDNIIFANNLISRIREKQAIYCLSKTKDLSTLKLCYNNNLYTITPTTIISNNSYNRIKKELKNGSIFLMETNNDNVIELNIIINYIKGKGIKIVGLSELLNEEYKP